MKHIVRVYIFIFFPIFIILNLTSSSSIAAREKVELTLEDCIKRALKNNNDLRADSINVRIAERQVAESAKKIYPTIELTSYLGVAPSAKGDVFRFEDDIDDYSDPGIYYQYNLNIKQPLYSFGKYYGKKKASEMKFEEEKAKIQRKREEVVYRIKTLYYDLLLTKELIKISEDVKSSFEKATEKAEEKLESDDPDITQQDVLKLKLGLVGTKGELNRLEHNLISIIESLKFELGVPPGNDFDIKSHILKQEKIELKGIKDYFYLTFQSKSTLKEKEAGLGYKEALLETAKSSYYPEIFIRTGVEGSVAPSRDDQRNPFVRDEYNYFKADIALGLKWSFDFNLNSSRVYIAEAELARAIIEKEALNTFFSNKINKIYLKVMKKDKGVKIARKARKISRSLMVTNLANFDFGIGEAKDLFESLFIYMRSVNNYLVKVRDYNIAVAELSFETGEEITNLVY